MASTASAAIDQFVTYYAARAQSVGFKPDETTTRDQRVAFLSTTLKAYCSAALVMKRASPDRPVSDEVVVSVLPGTQYRLFRDFIISGGSSEWRYAFTGHVEPLPTVQPLVNPLDLSTLADPVAIAPTVPGCTPAPVPEPIPPPQTFPYPDEPTQVLAFQNRVKAAYNSVGRPFPDPNDADAYRHFTRYGYDCSKMVEKASADKHIVELRQALGAPPE